MLNYYWNFKMGKISLFFILIYFSLNRMCAGDDIDLFSPEGEKKVLKMLQIKQYGNELRQNNKKYQEEHKRIYDELRGEIYNKKDNDEAIKKAQKHLKVQILMNKSLPEKLLYLLTSRKCAQKYKNDIQQFLHELMLNENLILGQKIGLIKFMILNYYNNQDRNRKQAQFIIVQLENIIDKLKINDISTIAVYMTASLSIQDNPMDPLWFYGTSLIYRNISNIEDDNIQHLRIPSYLYELYKIGAISEKKFKQCLIKMMRTPQDDKTSYPGLKVYIKFYRKLFKDEKLLKEIDSFLKKE